MSSNSAPMAFLVLAPQTSQSYPSSEATRTSSVSSGTTNSNEASPELAPTTSSAATQATVRTRRSSSISSSSSSSSTRRRFLKLGPVHFGGDPAESDFVEVEEA